MSEEQLDLAVKEIQHLIEDTIDKIKTSGEDGTVILVGGGSILVPPGTRFQGVKNIVLPEFFGNANALGAAIAQVSITIDRIKFHSGMDKEQVLTEFKQEVIQKVIDTGALAENIETIHDVIPLSYLPGLASRIIIKAIGELDINKLAADHSFAEIDQSVIDQLRVDEDPFIEQVRTENEEDQDIVIPMEHHYEIVDGRKEWILTEADVDCIAIGAGILGAGGGASLYLSTLVCKEIMH